MNTFTQGDLTNLEKQRNSNETMTEFLKNKRAEWNKKTEEVFKSIENKNINQKDFKKVIDSQSLALSYQQMMNDEIAFFMNKLSKSMTNVKMITQEKFIFYSTGFGMKTNVSEKKILIDAVVSENNRAVELIETHIDYLRDSVKNLQTFNYSVKNIVSLMDFLGK